MPVKQRGVYVRETFPGITEVRAVDASGTTVRRVTLPTAYYSQREVDDMWEFLDRISPRPQICLHRA